MNDATVLPGLAAPIQLKDGSIQWSSVPTWLTSFLQIGQRTAVAHEKGKKTCAVVIPPVRSFAALFCATGAVLGVATVAEAIPDIETHFSALASLAEGTPLVVKMADKIYAARFNCTVERAGRPYLKITYDGMTHLLPKEECRRAQVGSGGKRSLPTLARKSGPRTNRTIERLLGNYANDFLSVPTSDVVLVGRLSLLTQELENLHIRAEGNHSGESKLGALLRPSRLLPDGGIPRSLLTSDRVAEFDTPVVDTPHVVVFDGARAFSLHRTKFGESSWIAVLDRCSATFREGVDVANQEFASRRGSAPHLDDINVPPGTELQAFERAR